jgi:hypothetical protein
MTMTKDSVRQWLQRFDAIARADREALQREGPRPEWSISAALPLIEMARRNLLSSPQLQALRQQEDRIVSDAWTTIRQRLRV